MFSEEEDGFRNVFKKGVFIIIESDKVLVAVVSDVSEGHWGFVVLAVIPTDIN